jgi:hypothetical protein
MKNPYRILNVSQDADKKTIMVAQMLAMRENKYSLQEIHIAVNQLLIPAKRLAANFMFPAKIKAKRPQKISIDFQIEKLDINDINENAFNSLK